LLVPKLVFLKVEECHAKYGLETDQRVRGRKTELRYTEIKVPGKKNMVTAAIVIIDELSRWASRAIADVDFDIWRLISLSTCVERCNACKDSASPRIWNQSMKIQQIYQANPQADTVYISRYPSRASPAFRK
jgi:hypothetical protein